MIAATTTDPRIELLIKHFFARRDIVGVLAPWGKPCPAKPAGPLALVLEGHVLEHASRYARVRLQTKRGSQIKRSPFRVGSYVPDARGRTPWLCLDFDGAGHAEALADPRGAALQTYRTLRELGLPAHLEKSGGGMGWHLWCFFENSVDARKVRQLAFAVLPENVQLAGGGLASPKQGRGVEVFPKAARLAKDGAGNMVWLPFWAGGINGASSFHLVGENGEVTPYLPEQLETITEESLDRVLEGLPASNGKSGEGESSSDSWNPPRTWRKKALSKLPLESVYGDWLTGKSSKKGWLECQDPESTSGDQDPSAGVADGKGEAEPGTFHSFLFSCRTLSVFEFLIERKRAENLEAACQIVAELSGVPLPERADLPRIQANLRQLSEIIPDAWDALRIANTGPTIFLRGGVVSRVKEIDGRISLSPMTEVEMYGHLARVAHWYGIEGLVEVDRRPPKDVAADMLAYPVEDLPPLDAVVSAPVFDPEGRLVAEAGYHKEAKLLYAPPTGFAVDLPPDVPTEPEVTAARDFLVADLLADFPFQGDADKAHALAMLILPFVRRMFQGCAPVHLIEAPVQGSGKGLLADVASILVTGNSCEVATLGRDDDETRKRITALLLRDNPVILFDNVRGAIDFASLAAALTAETWTDRILGVSRMVVLPIQTTWVLTANNPVVSGEMSRRCVRIRIVPATERPWERTDFHHDPLREWVRTNRAALVRAILTLIQHWISEGARRSEDRLGSFEAWAGVVGGILKSAGVPGFLGNQNDLDSSADQEAEEWKEFVAIWWTELADEECAAGTLCEVAMRNNLLPSIRGEGGEASQMTRVGGSLRRVRGRVFGEFRIDDRKDIHSKGWKYQLVRVLEAEGGE